jgi:hypothetical protein
VRQNYLGFRPRERRKDQSNLSPSITSPLKSLVYPLNLVSLGYPSECGRGWTAMDVVVRYSPPSTLVSAVNASSYHSTQMERERQREMERRRNSLPVRGYTASEGRTPTSASTNQTIQQPSRKAHGNDQRQSAPYTSNTFNRAVQISLMEPVGSMSLSPANRDVVLAARKGLFILDLENPYDQPRFLPHLTTWVPADVQWNPHPARANWVASTVSIGGQRMAWTN